MQIPLSQIAELVSNNPLMDRQIVEDERGRSTVYELYQQTFGGFMLISYRQDFGEYGQYDEFASAQAALAAMPVGVAELMVVNVHEMF